MFTRYKKNAGALEAVAKVYSQQEHGIDPDFIDRDAVSVIERLVSRGYESYIVGGAVRDLLLGRVPKDFDVATSASPRVVHNMFGRSMIIGRRFRIVHVMFGKKIIEVTTFRSLEDHADDNDNVFGTIEEDCRRRDYSINSLYYNPLDCTVIDFTGAMEDFRRRRLVSLIPLNRTFVEDPVRMVRGVKYSVTTGFSMSLRLRHAIRKYAPLLQNVSTSRMTEEINKILSCGMSAQIFKALYSFGLLSYMLPCIAVYGKYPQLYESLSKLDSKVNDAVDDAHRKSLPKAIMYLSLVSPFIAEDPQITDVKAMFQDTLRQTRVLLSPMTPPRYELESTSVMFLRMRGVNVPKGTVKGAPRVVQKGGAVRKGRKGQKGQNVQPKGGAASGSAASTSGGADDAGKPSKSARKRRRRRVKAASAATASMSSASVSSASVSSATKESTSISSTSMAVASTVPTHATGAVQVAQSVGSLDS